MVSFDVAFPLVRQVPICGATSGPTMATVPPLEIYLSFVPAF
jgi:hypothetical protein